MSSTNASAARICCLRALMYCLLVLVSIPLHTTAAFAAGPPPAADPQSALDSANEMYQRGEYQPAAAAYQQLIRSGYDNGHIRYNLANSWYRLKRYGMAIAEYRRALLAIPSDPDVQANLKLARDKTQDRLEPDTGGAWYAGLLIFNEHLPLARMQLLFFIAYLLLWAVFASSSKDASHPSMPLLRNCLTGFVLVWGVLTFAVGPRRDGSADFKLLPSSWRNYPAVIVGPEVKVYSGNSETFQVIAVLHDGAEVEAFEQRGAWHGIILVGGRRGWVKEDGIQDV